MTTQESPGPEVSVLVVTYNHEDEIDSCIKAALDQEGVVVDVVVLDNASTDRTVERLVGWRDRIRLLRCDHNSGYAAAVNTAFRASGSALVALLNPDCVMEPGCLAALAGVLDADPSTGVAAAALRNPDGTPQLFARRDITLSGVVWDLTVLGRRVDRRLRGGKGGRNRRYEAEMGDGVGRLLAVDCPAAACVVVRRTDVGPAPFDERYPLFFNDGDLCRRLRLEGRRAVVVPDAVAVHGYGTSIRRADRAAIRAEFVRSMRDYCRPVWSRSRRLALDAVLLGDALSAAILGDAGHARGTLGGLGLPGGVAPWMRRRPEVSCGPVRVVPPRTG